MTDLRAPMAGPAQHSGRLAARPWYPQDSEWLVALQRVLDEPQRVRVHFQPIVDLQRGVVRGYEALARFAEVPGAPVVSWFEAAARLGYAGALEAQVMAAALLARPLLVRNRFVAVNLSPTALSSPEVAKVLRASHRLDAIVIELTERAGTQQLLEVRGAVDALRARGALLAVDDDGAGYGSVDHLLALRPQFLKLDGALTRGIATDSSRVAMVQTLKEVGEQLGAQLVAEGIEDERQLLTLARLGVPLGQGFALGRPKPAMVDIDRDLVGRLRREATQDERGGGVSRLLERVPAVLEGPHAVKLAFGAQQHLEHVVLVDVDQRPVGIVDRVSYGRGAPLRVPLRVALDTPVAEVARQAMARPLLRRWDPVVCVDSAGVYARRRPGRPGRRHARRRLTRHTSNRLTSAGATVDSCGAPRPITEDQEGARMHAVTDPTA